MGRNQPAAAGSTDDPKRVGVYLIVGLGNPGEEYAHTRHNAGFDAVDALAGHYDHEARQLGVPVEWRLELPRQLPVPEADLCMMLGNLLENAFHASQKLPPEQRQVKVMARMLSPAMLGLLVENRYDGVLKRQQGTLHSTKHDGMGIGLVSIQTAVSRYGGSMTVETENCLFRVNILLNL